MEVYFIKTQLIIKIKIELITLNKGMRSGRILQENPNSLVSITLSLGTWKIKSLFSFQASDNHTFSTFSYGINSTTNVFPTMTPYTALYMREPNLNINTATLTIQISTTLQLTQNQLQYIL